MEEKGQLKYKVGDRVSFEAVISDVDYSRQAPYRFTYRDGSGLWATKEYLEELTDKLPPRPQVTQKVMDWYEETKKQKVDSTIRDWFVASSMPVDVREWFFGENHLETQHALATLIAYGPEVVEVEKEKKYRVKLNLTNQILIDLRGDYVFAGFPQSYRLKFTKQELEQAGFGCVFGNPMFEVEEVVNG